MANKLPFDFYMQPDVAEVAKQLLGKRLITIVDGKYTASRITETEAYCGATDAACHAFPNKLTKRTEVMFGPGGHAYVYLCYGIHHLFNIVTNIKGNADAVLVRAVEPLEGTVEILTRTKQNVLVPKHTSGPGSLSKALGITTTHNGISLRGDLIWVEDAPPLAQNEIVATTRIGVGYAGADALLPWRFYESKSAFVSKR